MQYFLTLINLGTVCVDTACELQSVMVSGGSNDAQNPMTYLRSREMTFIARIATSCSGADNVVTTFCQTTWYANSLAGLSTAVDKIPLPSETMVLVVPPRFLPYSIYNIVAEVVSCCQIECSFLKLGWL